MAGEAALSRQSDVHAQPVGRTSCGHCRSRIAPPAEQQRIADKLDSVLARWTRAATAWPASPRYSKRFRQSVLSAATSGRLTAQWRAGRCLNDRLSKGEVSVDANTPEVEQWLSSLPESWDVLRASEVVEPGAEIVYGIVQPGPKLASGVPYVRGLDIVNGRIQVDQLLRTSPRLRRSTGELRYAAEMSFSGLFGRPRLLSSRLSLRAPISLREQLDFGHLLWCFRSTSPQALLCASNATMAALSLPRHPYAWSKFG